MLAFYHTVAGPVSTFRRDHHDLGGTQNIPHKIFEARLDGFRRFPKDLLVPLSGGVLGASSGDSSPHLLLDAIASKILFGMFLFAQ